MSRIGAILPIGNESEFEDIRTELRKLGVEWFERSLQAGNSIVFWFQESELSKLPTDPESQGKSKFPEYLPVDEESGHSISILDRYLDTWTGEDIRCPK